MRTVHLVVIVAIATLTSADATATAPGDLPRDPRELWERVDAEHRDIPLETEVLKTWEDGGIVFNVVRFTVGVYRGRKAKLAGYYAYPKGGRDLPALVQVNGGGQKAGTHGPRKWATYGSEQRLPAVGQGRARPPEHRLGRAKARHPGRQAEVQGHPRAGRRDDRRLRQPPQPPVVPEDDRRPQGLVLP